MENLMNKPATLKTKNGSIRGEFTGYSEILNCYMFSAYNGEVIKFSNLNNLKF